MRVVEQTNTPEPPPSATMRAPNLDEKMEQAGVE